jgi:phospholipase/carboxylesterase
MGRATERDRSSGRLDGLHHPIRGDDPLPVGTTELRNDRDRIGLVHIPGPAPPTGLPLVVMFHGGGADADQSMAILGTAAAEAGVALLAPEADGGTWDLLHGGQYGPDLARVDNAIAAIIPTGSIDPTRVALAGFSDGASYALSLGLDNGDQVMAVLAFSPGFASPVRRRDSPRIFISHGVGDRVLPIGRTSRRLVPALEALGLEVRYEEFPGDHTVPEEIARLALDWFLTGIDAKISPGR